RRAGRRKGRGRIPQRRPCAKRRPYPATAPGENEMKKLTLVLLSTLLLGALAFAHGNLAHVLGTVVQITDTSISVKTADGSIKVVAFDGETHFLKGEAPATIKDV